jgi:hypothetical protein
MILKIQRNEKNDWIYFDNVSHVSVKNSGDIVFAIPPEIEEREIHNLNNFDYSSKSHGYGLFEFDNNSKEVLFDKNVFVNDIFFNPFSDISLKDKEKCRKNYYAAKIIEFVIIGSTDIIKIACGLGQYNYLLNDEGKTIERL